MTGWIIGLSLWAAGIPFAFRMDAKDMILRCGYRRADAIHQAGIRAPVWPIRFVVWILDSIAGLIGRTLTSGLPTSQAERDAELAALERELGMSATAEDARDEAAGQLHLALAEAHAEESVEDRWQTQAKEHAARVLEILVSLEIRGALTDPTTGLPIKTALRNARDTVSATRRVPLGREDRAKLAQRVTRLERVIRANEIMDEVGKVCSRCGCSVVPGMTGYIHTPAPGQPFPCDHATMDPVPWHETPEGSPERQAVKERTLAALRGGPFGKDLKEEWLQDAERLLDSFKGGPLEGKYTISYLEEGTTGRRPYLVDPTAVPEELDEIRSVSLDGTETVITSGWVSRRELHDRLHGGLQMSNCPFCDVLPGLD